MYPDVPGRNLAPQRTSITVLYSVIYSVILSASQRTSITVLQYIPVLRTLLLSRKNDGLLRKFTSLYSPRAKKEQHWWRQRSHARYSNHFTYQCCIISKLKQVGRIFNPYHSLLGACSTKYILEVLEAAWSGTRRFSSCVYICTPHVVHTRVYIPLESKQVRWYHYKRTRRYQQFCV